MTKTGHDFLSTVVPVFKEVDNIAPFVERYAKVMEGLDLARYELIFCMDPCEDGTREAIERAMEDHPFIRLITFTRRFGQPACTLAGIFEARGDACVIIDVDLQDPPEVIPALVAKWREGDRVVCARRSSREGENIVRKLVASLGYRVIHAISEVDIPVDTGDFRLIDRRVIEGLRQLSERNGYLRGMVATVGYKTSYVEYRRDPRSAGTTKYNRLTGSLRIGANAVFSFSSKPLLYVAVMGFVLLGAGVVMAILNLAGLAASDTSFLRATNILIVMMGGLQIVAIGIAGQYITRIFDEVKGRPMYMIDEIKEGEEVRE